MTIDRSTLISRIQKLMALSKSDNQHEAELAAAKASQLMEEYQIGVSEVEIKTSYASHNIVEEGYVVEGLKLKLHWVESLAHGCAKLFDATILANSRLHGTSFRFVGFPEDIAAAKALFEHLYLSWYGICERDLRSAKDWQFVQHGTRFTPGDTMKFKQGHGVGYAGAIFRRCVELAKERKGHVSTTGTSLVVVKDTALTDYGRAHKWTTTKQATSLGSSDGLRAGRAAGGSVHIGKNLSVSPRALPAA